MTASSSEGSADVFGRELRRLRQRARLTQADVARDVDVQRATLSQWETGRHLPSADKVAHLDRLLDAGGELVGAAGEARDTGETSRPTSRRISLYEVNARMARV